MAVALRSVGVSPGAESYSVVITKPVGLSVGDLMIAHIAVLGESTMDAVPSGFNLISAFEVGVSILGSYLYYKIADSGDAAASDFTFTLGDGEAPACFAAMSAWTGADSTNPINDNNGQTNGVSNTCTAPQITPSVADCLILMICTVKDRVTLNNYAIAVSNPASWSEAYDLSSSYGYFAIAVGYADRPETTATGNGTASIQITVDNNIGNLIAVAPYKAPPPENGLRQIPHCGPRKKRTEWLSTMRM